MTAPLRITHVLPRVGMTGPVRAVGSFARRATRLGLEQRHRVFSLEGATSPLARRMLRRAGASVEDGTDRATLDAAIADADVTVLHWWSCPSVARFLQRPLPATRLAVWLHVMGDAPPQVLTHGVVDTADALLVTSPGTLELPVLHDRGPEDPAVPPTTAVPAILDTDRLEGFAPVPHDGVVVGYLGTVNRSKMHPRFVELCRAVTEPDARFLVVGGGGAEQELRDAGARAGLGDRLEVRGFTEDISGALSTMDVFGYPLRDGTYASSEVALQEAMWVGIPPVVFPYGGIRHLVEHGRTGLVANDDAEYAQHVSTLVRDPDLRDTLGRAARDEARWVFDPAGPTRAMDAALRACAAGEAHRRPPPDWGPTPGEWFAHSLGCWAAPFLRDLADPGEDDAATAAIAGIDAAVAGGEGGLYHWCNFFPEDPDLRRWARILGGVSTP